MQIGRGTALGLIVALAIPLLWPSLPPLIDLLGHVGRYHIQLNIPASQALQKYFAVEWKFVPNLGVDLLVQALGPLLGVEGATKLVVVFIPVLTGAGILILGHEIHGRISPGTIFALALTYHYPLLFGFVNFSLGMALVFLAAGLWLALGRRGVTRLRAMLFLVIAPAIYIVHVSAWGALGVIIFGIELGDRAENARGWIRSGFWATLSCVPLSLPALFMALNPGDGGGGVPGDWFHWRIIIYLDA